MKTSLYSFITIIILFFSINLCSQNFTINGITGISFNESGSDYSINITDDFTAFGMVISPQSVTLDYTAATNSFSITGVVENQFDGNTINSTISFTIENQSLQSLTFDISGDFDLDDLTFSPTGLTFQYDSSSSLYEMFGDVSISFDGNTIDVVLGDDTDPGIEIDNGSLEQVNASFTADFTINGLSFSPSNLTFQYDSSSSLYEMFGDTSISFDGNTVDVVLGDNTDPGIEISGGSLQQLVASLTADFTINGLSFSPNNLTFKYDSSSSLYEMFGDTSISFDGNTVDVVLGNDTDPGIEINGGSLQQLNASITADFAVNDLDFSPSGLTFQYDASDDHYEMFGDASISFGGNTLSIGLGDDTTPGLVIDQGTLKSLDISITTDFDVSGVTLSPDNLTFIYNESTQEYEMYGLATITMDGNMIKLDLGSESDPGLEFLQGSVDKINASITSDFNMKSITFKSNGLGFRYDAQSQGGLYDIYGETDVTFDNETISIRLGDANSAGFEYYSNAVQKIDMEVTADFTMKGIEFNPQSFGFDYDKANDQFEMYGTIKSKIEGNNIDLSLGDSSNPGLTIINGVVNTIDMSVTADFSFEHMTFSPDDLTFVYNHSQELYEMYGELSVTFEGETLDVNLGDSSTPGLKYKNNVVESIDIGVTANFRLKKLEFEPQNLTFIYRKNGKKYEMYGDVELKVENFDANVAANLGNSSNPGFLFENGQIKHINIAVTGDFKMSGLDIRVDDLGADWDSSSGYYHVYGSASVHVDGQSISADFGTVNDPGFVFKEGKWHYFNVDLNADFKIGNLEVIAKDLDVSCCSDGYFIIKGELEVKEVFSLAVTLGHDGQGGLFIDTSGSTPKFKLEDFTIDIEHANLGAIDLKQVKLEFNNDGIVESDVKVVFPEGWEIDSKMKFKDVHGKAEIDEISLAYRANNLDDAIEIFEGVQLSYLEGDVKNLTTPSKLEVSGGIGTIYGGGFTLDNRSATFLEMSDNVTISSKEFKIDGDVNVGAYREGTNSWHALLGSGSIDLTAYFHHYIKARVKAKYPGDPLIEADLSVYFDSHGHFDGLLDVEFIVPHWVPFIGGKHYGSVDGAVRYKKGYLHDSFGAAWVRIHTFWHTYHEGAKYNFGSRHTSSIGSGSISSIESTIHHDEGNRSLAGSSKVFEFNVPQPAPNSMLIDIDWDGEVEEALVTVIGPEGTYELTKAVITQENAIDETPTMSYEENMTLIERDTVTTFLFKTPSAFSQEEIIHSNIVDGRYQLIISFPGEETEIDTIQFKPKWQIPASNIVAAKTADNKYNLEIDYWTALPDSTYISFYVNNVNSYEEGRLINHVKATNFDELGNGTETLLYTPKYFEGNTNSLYFYAVIEDGVNPPFQSVISSVFDHEHDFYGTVTLNNPSPDLEVEGLRVFLDIDNDGNFDTASTGGIEPFSLVDENGGFSFPDLTNGTYNLRIVLPSGYRFVGETDNFSSKTVVFNGTPMQLSLTIETY